MECELLVEDKSQKKACKEEEIMPKGIELFIVRTPDKRMVPHAPNDSESANNKHQFHNSIVDWNEVGEEIQIARQKHQRVQLLCLQRNPWGGKQKSVAWNEMQQVLNIGWGGWVSNQSKIW